MNKKIIIIGAGKNGLVAANIISLNKNSEVIGFLDDAKSGKDILGKVSSYQKFIKDSYFFISIADNSVRKKIYLKLKKDKAKLINAIHPTAYIEKSAKIGENVMIGVLSYININSIISDNTIINNGCIIEHDNQIDKHCNLSPGTISGGVVNIREKVFIGLGTTIRDRVTIHRNCIIGMGSNVTEDTKPDSMYYGNPAKFIKKLQ